MICRPWVGGLAKFLHRLCSGARFILIVKRASWYHISLFTGLTGRPIVWGNWCAIKASKWTGWLSKQHIVLRWPINGVEFGGPMLLAWRAWWLFCCRAHAQHLSYLFVLLRHRVRLTKPGQLCSLDLRRSLDLVRAAKCARDPELTLFLLSWCALLLLGGRLEFPWLWDSSSKPCR